MTNTQDALSVLYFTENSYILKLRKGSSGLGFSIAGGTDADGDTLKRVIRIKQIFPASPAAHSGRLQVGDVILQVNGQRTDSMKRSVSVLFLYDSRMPLVQGSISHSE